MSNFSNLRWCSSCLAMSTRPRMEFDSDGNCNACNWAKTKNEMDWSHREEMLIDLLEKQRAKNKPFDCLVPVSGGKDGSYVAYQLKHKYGMNPLCVTISPALQSDLGILNLHNFIASGYDHVTIAPSATGMQKLNKVGFIEKGFPYYGWLISILTAVLHVAKKFDIDLIFYGENGEVEYGGETETNENPFYNVAYQKRIYLEGGYDKVLNAADLSKTERYFFEYPEFDNEDDVKLVHWSSFENWDPYRNYLVAKEHCGLTEADTTNAGTFTNFSQNDQLLYALHAYLMFLKFGFGRANQDACIEIRRGAMSRSQAKNLVQLYDGSAPVEFMDDYLRYFDMSRSEFDLVLDKWANQEILVKRDGYWVPKFEIV